MLLVKSQKLTEVTNSILRIVNQFFGDLRPLCEIVAHCMGENWEPCRSIVNNIFNFSVHCNFGIFRVFLSLCQTASQLYRLSHTNALRINQFYQPKDQSMKFSWKNIENWRSPENDFCLVFWFSVCKKPRRFIHAFSSYKKRW